MSTTINPGVNAELTHSHCTLVISNYPMSHEHISKHLNKQYRDESIKHTWPLSVLTAVKQVCLYLDILSALSLPSLCH